MKKALFFMLVFVVILFGAVFLLKKWISYKEQQVIQSKMTPVFTVSSTTAKISAWTMQLKSTGSLRTYKGIDVTTELPGMVEHIYFKGGKDVKKGDLLVRLDIKPDVAKLRELEANANLAKITYFRDKKQFSFGAISQQALDNARDQYESTAALVEEQKATIDKKIIRAPFTGRLGISLINLGQYLNPGDDIVTLQTLDPIYVTFYLPQQDIGKVYQGQTISMRLDRAPNEVFRGKINAINPKADSNIRNVEIEATLANPNYILLPGMFSNVTIDIGKPKKYITLPYSAITFNPYGALIYTLIKTSQTYNGKTVWKAQQKFVVTGDTRGDQVVIKKGVKVGDTVVSAGQLKLRNNSRVIINNKVQPADNAKVDVPERD